MTKDIDFKPVHFLRCHSRKNDSADVQTQVWMCLFEPDPKSPKNNTTNIVATCGGNSVCFIDVETGKVVAKYFAKDLREMFYTLTWTTWEDSNNVLASGGARNVVHFVLPSENLAFMTFPLKARASSRIQALLFHPSDTKTLFCGSSDGEVRVCKITFQHLAGSCKPPYEGASVEVIQQFSAESEIFSLAFCVTSQALLSGCNDGLMGWEIDSDDFSKPVKLIKFKLPVAPNCSTELVDSVEILGGGMVASKCALHAGIYLWHIPTALKNASKVAPTHVLHWSDTDNYFMYLGAHRDAGLLCCGDDEGALWLYDLEKLDLRQPNSCIKPVPVEPCAILPWPILSDANTEKKRKLNLDVYDIVVDKVTVNCNGKYLVAVTNNNMVCIWRRL